MLVEPGAAIDPRDGRAGAEVEDVRPAAEGVEAGPAAAEGPAEAPPPRQAEGLGAAEREDIRLYSAATKAGWSADELRKIGFDQPAKSRRVTQRRRQNNVAAAAAEPSGS